MVMYYLGSKGFPSIETQAHPIVSLESCGPKIGKKNTETTIPGRKILGTANEKKCYIKGKM